MSASGDCLCGSDCVWFITASLALSYTGASAHQGWVQLMDALRL
ncbi:hypothetical protein CP97_07560 [Aurantiacibacter atlanticus]|uniref:Uncharacterized protein n=1 Tax=Aurantiacibacter atlanticus TaxID=1648404 RepID=A0A0H4VGG5_9SPHN|nr:hypothetical protein CP97_07560 [Aurantiacibacter atlanticus]